MVQSCQKITYTEYFSSDFLRYILAEYSISLPLVSTYLFTIAIAKLIKTAKPLSKSKFLRAMLSFDNSTNNFLLPFLLLANWIYNFWIKNVFDGIDVWVSMLLLQLLLHYFSRT
jgi:hypothetical protein